MALRNRELYARNNDDEAFSALSLLIGCQHSSTLKIPLHTLYGQTKLMPVDTCVWEYVRVNEVQDVSSVTYMLFVCWHI